MRYLIHGQAVLGVHRPLPSKTGCIFWTRFESFILGEPGVYPHALIFVSPWHTD